MWLFFSDVALVPGRAPAVTSGSYVNVDCGHLRRCVRVYWQVGTFSTTNCFIIRLYITPLFNNGPLLLTFIDTVVFRVHACSHLFINGIVIINYSALMNEWPRSICWTRKHGKVARHYRLRLSMDIFNKCKKTYCRSKSPWFQGAPK